MAKRYPNLKEEVNSSIPGREISPLLDKKTFQVVKCLIWFGVGLLGFLSTTTTTMCYNVILQTPKFYPEEPIPIPHAPISPPKFKHRKTKRELGPGPLVADSPGPKLLGGGPTVLGG